MRVTIIDLGVSNIGSLQSALDYLGVRASLTSDPEALEEASHIILPGVGAFDAAMSRIVELDLDGAIRRHAEKQRPLLGVCLGMQLLFDGSDEGKLAGLGIITGRFERLMSNSLMPLKVPHVGFDRIYDHHQIGLFRELGDDAYFYFTHSYALFNSAPGCHTVLCDYGGPFVAAVSQSSVSGVQFHPEKSQSNGLRVLYNFLSQ